MELPAVGPAHSTTATEFFFLEACGNEGKLWRDEFESGENSRLWSDLWKVLRLFRTHRLREGRELLTSVEVQLCKGVSGSPSIVHLLWRYVFSAKAYLQYLSDDFESAKTSLERASEEIRIILELDRFLLPLAIHCTDFIIQQARIARRERNWMEVKRHIATLEQIATGDS